MVSTFIKTVRNFGSSVQISTTNSDLEIKSNFPVVAMDVMMPNYDGFYALKEIRKIDPDAKVIMLTADLTLDTEKRVKELKASAITYKPYEIDSLIEILDKVKRNDFAVLTSENKSMI